jgi:PAS domain S-box-containing protein
MIESETTPHDAALAVRLFGGSPDGLQLVGGDGRIVLANRSATSIFGYSSGELGGSCLIAPVEPLGAELVWQVPT